MKSVPPAWETDKAYSAGISFSSGHLYGQLREYGLQQSPKQTVSVVVCAAAREFLKARGFPDAEVAGGVSQAEIEAIHKARQAGVNPVDALLEATTRALEICPDGQPQPAVSGQS